MRRVCAAVASVFLLPGSVIGAEPGALSPKLYAQAPPGAADLAVPLMAAAASGKAADIRRLREAGADLERRDSGGRTALHVAVHAGNRETVAALLDLSADPNALDAQRYDAITIAGVRGDADLVRLLVARGANPAAVTSPYQGTALIASGHRGHVEVVRTLIAAKAPLDHVNNLGWTALLEAIILGDGGAAHTEIVRLLVVAGADVNRADRDGVRPLAHARRRAYREMSTILERAGARP
jgi:ankyrin repeat protein